MNPLSLTRLAQVHHALDALVTEAREPENIAARTLELVFGARAIDHTGKRGTIRGLDTEK
jgi:hypothetical protein